MTDEPIPHAEPLPLRPSAARGAPPPAWVVRRLLASLRATEVYVRLLVDRIELARTSGLVQLGGVPANVLVQLADASDVLRERADHTLGRLDPQVARTARAVAEIACESAGEETSD